jgi:hypothetical protein
MDYQDEYERDREAAELRHAERFYKAQDEEQRYMDSCSLYGLTPTHQPSTLLLDYWAGKYL